MPKHVSGWIPHVARCFFGVSLVVFGLQHVLLKSFITRIIPAGTGSWLLPPAAALPTGVLLIALGGLLLLRVQMRAAALLLSAVCLVSFCLLHVPAMLGDVAWGGTWTAGGKAATFLAMGLLLAREATHLARNPSSGSGPRVSRILNSAATFNLICGLFAAFLILAGIQHFVWAAFVQTLVPSWAGVPKFWTYAAGIGLILGGAGLCLRPLRVVAGVSVGTVIFLWFWMLHVPRAVTLRNANETTAVFEALSFAGLAWLIAAVAFRRSSPGN